MLAEFKKFILRGNVIDLAVAVVIGAAFTAIINSLVNDIIMPLIGLILGKVDFASLSITIGDSVIAYGKFIMAIVNFLIVALVLFLVIKAINRVNDMKKKEEAAAPPPEPPADVKLLTEIRDLLNK
jgi:large conductance mechanosensitive channel